MIELINIEQVKTVKKPWGQEKWIADGSPKFPYALKEIILKAGNKSSLQFHKHKQESNFILEGEGVLHMSDIKVDVNKYENGEYSEDELNELIKSVKQIKLSPGMVFHVFPGYIHRVEAITDLKQVESSTTELDDVYRIADDTNRPDGKIEHEHSE